MNLGGIELAVKLRLTRMGKKKQPFYRIVATDSRTRRDGKYIEKIGYYNPITEPSEVVIDEEKAFYWLKNGAIPSNTVKDLFSKKGIMLKWHLMSLGLDEPKIEEEFKKWEVLQLEKQKRKEALEAQAKREKDIAPAEVSESEAEVESKPEADEDSEPVATEDSGSKEEVSAEKAEETVAAPAEDEAPAQNKDEVAAEEQTSEVEESEESNDKKDK